VLSHDLIISNAQKVDPNFDSGFGLKGLGMAQATGPIIWGRCIVFGSDLGSI
jgi:hypothetical protein